MNNQNVRMRMMDKSFTLYITYVDLRSHYKVNKDILKNEGEYTYNEDMIKRVTIEQTLIKDLIRNLLRCFRAYKR